MEDKMGNILCDLIGIKYPILLGGMLFIGRAKLASAVSESGGLGVLAAGSMNPEELREEIKLVRNVTAKPFGINVPVRSPWAEALIKVIIEESVKIITTSAGDPFRFTQSLKENGITVIHVIPTVAHAQRAQQAGVDVVVAEGSESGGYINPEEVATMALIPQVVDAVTIPVIAAGGIADGRGLLAALCLGAVGVQLGTRFLATEECQIPEDYKRALILASDTDTVVIKGERSAHRDLKKELIERARSSGGGPLMNVKEMVEDFEKGTTKIHLVDKGEVSIRSAGQSAGLIRQILPVKEVIENIMAEAQQLMAHLPDKLANH